MMKPDPTETSIEVKRQYLVAVEDLADRLRRDLELAVSKAEPATVATPCGAVSDDMPMLACVLAEGHPGLHAYGNPTGDRPVGPETDQLVAILKDRAEAAEAKIAEQQEALIGAHLVADTREAEIGQRDVQILKLETTIEKHERDLASLNRHIGQLNEWLTEERRSSKFLDDKLQERDRQIEALDYELGETKRQLAHRDETIQALVRRINAIRIATDLSAETD